MVPASRQASARAVPVLNLNRTGYSSAGSRTARRNKLTISDVAARFNAYCEAGLANRYSAAKAEMRQTMDKAAVYRDLKAEIESVVAGETSVTARYATASCILAQAFRPRFFWTGFYLVDPLKERELVVGPYQGTLGCLRIPFGKGVCGHVAATQEPIIVPDVHAFPGHIACDSATNSEIVLPVFDKDGQLAAVLDVDSTQPDAFDEVDREGLAAICEILLVA
jgi:GAF domain-containing protein